MVILSAIVVYTLAYIRKNFFTTLLLYYVYVSDYLSLPVCLNT